MEEKEKELTRYSTDLKQKEKDYEEMQLETLQIKS